MTALPEESTVSAIPPHPAPFTDVIVERLKQIIANEVTRRQDVELLRVLDPFAGVGNCHRLMEVPGVKTVGVEMEPEWPKAHPRTMVGDACDLPFADSSFDAIVTSPCYGNRMADHHDARDGSRRVTYKHYLGRDLTEGSAGELQWGRAYKELHWQAWSECDRVLRPGGLFVVNISNHVRKGEEMPVVEWHVKALLMLGLFVRAVEPIRTPRMKFGANHARRVESEYLLVMYATRRPSSTGSKRTGRA